MSLWLILLVGVLVLLTVIKILVLDSLCNTVGGCHVCVDNFCFNLISAWLSRCYCTMQDVLKTLKSFLLLKTLGCSETVLLVGTIFQCLKKSPLATVVVWDLPFLSTAFLVIVWVLDILFFSKPKICSVLSPEKNIWRCDDSCRWYFVST